MKEEKAADDAKTSSATPAGQSAYPPPASAPASSDLASGVRYEEASDGKLYQVSGTSRTHRMVISPRGKPRAYQRVADPKVAQGGPMSARRRAGASSSSNQF